MSKEISKTLNSSLYPDLAKKGGLVAALQQELGEMEANLVAFDPGFLVYAFVRSGDRSSQVTTAARERAFCVDFWHQGVVYGNGWVDNLSEVGRAIVSFYRDLASIQELGSRFQWFGTNMHALAHEKGASYFVDDAWQRLENRLNEAKVDSSESRLLALVHCGPSSPTTPTSSIPISVSALV